MPRPIWKGAISFGLVNVEASQTVEIEDFVASKQKKAQGS